ncbi:MAG: MFS transporter [Candidatus Hodarchaeota archaeon]
MFIFLHNSRFYSVVWILFLLDRGLSFTEITALDVVFWGIIILLSLPAGIFADRFGRKKGLIGGELLVAVGIVFFVANPTVIGVFFAYIIWSTGSAFLNGPEQAFIYDYLKAQNQEERFSSVWRNAMIIMYIAWALASLVGGILGENDLGYPFFLAMISYVLAALVAFSFEEKRPETEEEITSPVILFQEAVDLTRRTRKLQILFILSSIIMCMSFVEVIFRAPLLKDYGFDESELGVIYLVIVLIAAFGAFSSGSLSQKLGKHRLYVLIPWCLVFILLVLSQTSKSTVVVALVCVFFVGLFRGLTRPVMAEILNEWVPSRIRASIITLGSGISLIFLWIFEPLSGVIAEAMSIQDTFLVLGSINVVLLIALSLLWFHSLKEIAPIDSETVPIVEAVAINGRWK